MPYRPYPNVDRALRQIQRHAQPEPAGTYVLSTHPVAKTLEDALAPLVAMVNAAKRVSPGRAVLPDGTSRPVEARTVPLAEAVRRGMVTVRPGQPL